MKQSGSKLSPFTCVRSLPHRRRPCGTGPGYIRQSSRRCNPPGLGHNGRSRSRSESRTPPPTGPRKLCTALQHKPELMLRQENAGRELQREQMKMLFKVPP